jgi:hypothetical protein
MVFIVILEFWAAGLLEGLVSSFLEKGFVLCSIDFL